MTHTTSLELSKRLKSLGVPQESYFYWVKRTNGWFITTEPMVSMRPTEYGETSSFLASELAEILPKDI